MLIQQNHRTTLLSYVNCLSFFPTIQLFEPVSRMSRRLDKRLRNPTWVKKVARTKSITLSQSSNIIDFSQNIHYQNAYVIYFMMNI